MENTNPVSQILAPIGNLACLASGARPDTLAIGQVGFFNVHTGLSVDGSVPVDAKDIFIAVGSDPLGTGSLSDIIVSTGQMIQAERAKYLTFKGYLAALPKIIDVAAFIARCETDYQLKIELRNGLGYELNGYNQIAKTFNFKTGCCADQCAPCALGDTNELALGMIKAINNDPEAFLTATGVNHKVLATVNTEPTADGNVVVTIGGKYIYTVAVLNADTFTTSADKIVAAINASADPIFASNVAGAITVNGSTAGNTFTVLGAGMTVNAVSTTDTVVTVANIPAFVAANPGATLGIRITANPLTTNLYGTINLNYTKGRSTDMSVALLEGFTCNGVVNTIQELQRVEGAGYDLRQLEFVDGGWNGKSGPYRQSTILGQERAGIVYNISLTGTYNVFSLGYDIKSASGFRDYYNACEVLIAVPCADNTTMASLATFMDAIFPQFGAMANDVAANGDCTNTRTGLLTAATDGLESLA